jgi:capsular exopolysaccharide synthesis family protein
MTKEMYDTVRRRIQELEMERKRPARISEAYYAQNVMFQDDRMKYAGAVVFGAMVSGFGLAFLADRFDSSLHTPDDVTRHTRIRVLGTTANLSDLKKSQAPHQIADDYHTICTNLRLFGDGQIPQKLVISSSRPGEGKTTLAVNLATSIAKTGKKVLLIDGDLRKPELARRLNIPHGSNKLNDAVWDDDFADSIYATRWSGVDVLPARPHESSDIYKLLSQQRMNDVIDRLAEQYDHIIIDTPPIMVFSDALLWAKISGTVLLTSFSGTTTEADLNHSIERMMQINVNVVGVVLNNVRVFNSYNYYRYGHYSDGASTKKRTAKSASLLLANEENVN